MLFPLYLLALSPLALLRAYPLFEQSSFTPINGFLPVAPFTVGNSLSEHRTPQEYPSVVASSNTGYSNENAPSSADAPNNLISFYGADSDSNASSGPAKSHDGYCRDSLPNKLCCDDGVRKSQSQDDLKVNCQICMLPRSFLWFGIVEADLMLL